MAKNKAQQLADWMNLYAISGRESDHREIAQTRADTLRAGLYWYGTAEPAPHYPSAEVWHVNERGTWCRRIGIINLGADGIWRAGHA